MGWLWNNDSASKSSSSSSDSASAVPSASSTSNSTPAQTQQTNDFHDAFPHLAPSEPSDSSLESQKVSEYQDTMSCRQAFDAAFYCQSLGGKFNDIYRYGELRSCNEHWSDFWFCMRNKSKSESVKKQLIIERFKAKEDKIRSGPNSEDIWTARKPHERLQNPFRGEPEED